MINFIVYEDQVKFRDIYFSIIDNYFNNNKLTYNIIELSKYDEEIIKEIDGLSDNKIYVLDIEVPGMNGIDFARQIRKEKGDWQSPIIIVTSHEDMKNYDVISDILALAFISKLTEFEKEFYNKIRQAHQIMTSYDLIRIKNKGEYNQIRIRDIIYIEKEKDDYKCCIRTKNGKVPSNMTLLEIEKSLENHPEFIKVNRSSIINTEKISKFDLNNDYIEFKNIDKRIKVSRSHKKNFIKRLIDKES